MADQIKIIKINLEDYKQLRNKYPDSWTIKGKVYTWDPAAVYVNPDTYEVLGGTAQSIVDIQAAINKLKTGDISDLKGQVEDLFAQTDNLEEELSKAESDIQSTAGELATTKSELTDTKNSLQGTKEKLETEIGTRTTEVARIEKTTEGLTATVTDHATSISKIKQTADKVEAAVFDGETNRISLIEQTAESIKATVEDPDHGLSVVEQKADSIKTTVGDLTKEGGRISQIEQTADGISQRVGSIESWQTNTAATKDFVNSSIASNTGELKGNFDVKEDLGLDYTATDEEIAAALKLKISGSSNNDYCYVKTKNGETDCIKRFKYSGKETIWLYEYTLNNSSFTAAQWATINSGLVSGDVEILRADNLAISELTTRQNSIEASVGTINDQIVSISGNVAGQAVTLETHASQISTLEITAEGITSSVGKLETSVETLDGSVTQLDSRTSAAETQIEQNKEEIALRALSSEVYTKGETYNKTETAAEIKTASDKITSTVASTYETKTDAETMQETLASQISQTDSQIRADVVAKTGGDEDSFGWSLTTDGFTLHSNGAEVFNVDDAGNVAIAGNVTIGTYSKKSEAIGGVKIEYAQNNSATTAPSTGWSETMPTWAADKYIWQKTTQIYANGTQKGEPSITCIQGKAGTDGAKGEKGEQGDKGDKGESFSIYKTYSSVELMEADYANVELGKFVLIDNSINQEENSRLYVRKDNVIILDKDTAHFAFLTNMSGPQGSPGPQGPQGPAGKDGIDGQDGKDGINGKDGKDGANGKDGAPGPKGDPGDKGEQGEQGIQGEPGPKGDTGDAGEPGPQGDKGDQGEQGEKGEKGDKGDKGDKGEKGDPGENGKDGENGEDGRSVLSTIKYYRLATSEPSKPIVKDPTDWFISPPAYTEGNYYESVRTLYNKIDDSGKDFEWSDVIQDSQLTVNFINSLGITAKKISVLDEENKTLFEADGLAKEPYVQLANFNVQSNTLSGTDNTGYNIIISSAYKVQTGTDPQTEEPTYTDYAILAGDKFKLTTAGDITAQSGTIGGFSISNNTLQSIVEENGNQKGIGLSPSGIALYGTGSSIDVADGALSISSRKYGDEGIETFLSTGAAPNSRMVFDNQGTSIVLAAPIGDGDDRIILQLQVNLSLIEVDKDSHWVPFDYKYYYKFKPMFGISATIQHTETNTEKYAQYTYHAANWQSSCSLQFIDTGSYEAFKKYNLISLRRYDALLEKILNIKITSFPANPLKFNISLDGQGTFSVDLAERFSDTVVFWAFPQFKHREDGSSSQYFIEMTTDDEVDGGDLDSFNSSEKLQFNFTWDWFSTLVVSGNSRWSRVEKLYTGYEITYTMSVGNITTAGHLLPGLRYLSNSICDVGSSSTKWRNGYFIALHTDDGAIQASDAVIKIDVADLSSKYDKLFDKLQPKSYKLIYGTNNRHHTGFIAQDVADAANASGITADDFAAFIKWDKPDSVGASCGLRYEEFVAINTDQIQKLKKRTAALETENAKLKERLEAIESKLNN